MANVINLRRVRKQKTRDAEEKKAALNRQKFGRTKAEKLFEKSEQRLVAQQLDGHKRDPG
jgi:hypothetical protein